MPTPKNAPYKLLQRSPSYTVTPIWQGAYTEWESPTSFTKRPYMGPCKKVKHGPQGKVAKKAARRLSHTRRYYLIDRLNRRLSVCGS